MRLQTIAAIAGGILVALSALPAVLLARRLRYLAFEPKKDRIPAALELQVTAISDTTVTLRKAAKNPSIQPDIRGEYLLRGARGWGYAGRVIDSNEIIAIREFRPGGGSIHAGDYARLDPYAHPDDPFVAHGYNFQDVTFESALGEFPAWYVPGSTKTWAIMVHGKGAERRETLRMMPALVDAGFHVLAITYRHDADLPSGSGRYSYGLDEWEELEGAAAYALAHGAEDLVLVGYSMGGAISLSFMARSPHAAAVSALILDAPMTHLEDTVAYGAKNSGVPARFLAVSNRVAARLYRFRWDDWDYLRTVAALKVPVLLFHGDTDATIPVALSDRFAQTAPDIVRYVRLKDCAHVRAWNVDPEAYLRTVRDFVANRRSVRPSR